MMTRLLPTLVFTVLVLWISQQNTRADFYVSPDGADANPGTEAAPFATLEKARDAVRAVKSEGKPLTVWLRGGTYRLPAGFQLTAEDAGTEAAPITWSRYKNEQPILVGGRTVDNFQPYRDTILAADLKDTPLDGVRFKQLTSGGKRQPLARYPNFDAENPYAGGWAYADGTSIPMYQDIPDEPRNTFVVKEGDFHEWAKPGEMQVFVFARYNWWNNIVDVKEIDLENRRVTLTADASYPIRPGDRYYFQNALEELDAPGEWYLDVEAKRLYFWPPEGTREPVTVVVPTCRDILKVENAAHLRFHGLTFECCDGSAIVVTNSDRVTVSACTVRSVGDYRGTGISVSGGKNNRILGCDIFETGSNGIWLGGGDRKTLTPAGHEVLNCHIHHTGVYYKQGVGVSVGGVGHRVANCLIHHGPRFAIGYGGNNHVFELNEMHHMNLETEDTGATYTGGRDWINGRGCVIRHNFIHDMLGFGRDASGTWKTPHYAWGVYLDDNAGGCDVIGNIVVRCPRALIHLHNGRDNLVENNIFVDADQQQMEFGGWTDTSRMWTDHFKTMVPGYESVAGEPAWASMRNMKLHPKDAVLPDKTIMSGNVFRRNIFSWRNENAKYVRANNFNFEHNEIDGNLVWHYGKPIRTDFHGAGPSIGDNLLPNGDFEKGEAGKLPENWTWQCHPSDKTRGLRELDADGKNAILRIDADFVKEKPRDNHPIVCSRPIQLVPGKTYRLKARLKAADLPDGTDAIRVSLYMHHWTPNTPYWGGGHGHLEIGPDWKEFERIIRIPGPGEAGYHENLDMIRVSLSMPSEVGALLIDDVTLFEAESIDEWTAWQMKGMDKSSVIADPKFLGSETARQDIPNAKATDFLPGPDSPAWKLGFQPIPAEKIGLYDDENRASPKP